MRRRDLLASAAFLIAGAAPPMAQTSGKIARIGVLLQVPPSAAAVQPLWRALVDGLREHGWEEGRNLIIEGRFAGQNPERFHDLAAELVALPVDVILAANAQSIEAARRRTATIPIVMTGQADPDRVGFVASLARPGGNITGVAIERETLLGKHLELLMEIRPGVERVGLIYDPTNILSASSLRLQQELASRLGLTLVPIPVTTPADIGEAFAAIAGERLDALQVLAVPIVLAHRTQIAAFAIQQRLPTITGFKVLVADGLLMSYADDPVAAFRRAAWYVDRILRGAKPAELPVEQMSRFELVINLRAARAIGLEIPPAFLARADELID